MTRIKQHSIKYDIVTVRIVDLLQARPHHIVGHLTVADVAISLSDRLLNTATQEHRATEVHMELNKSTGRNLQVAK